MSFYLFCILSLFFLPFWPGSTTTENKFEIPTNARRVEWKCIAICFAKAVRRPF